MQKKVRFSKKEIETAGSCIASDLLTVEERENYLTVIDYWRAAHAFPMNAFAAILRAQVCDLDDVIVVQRLKRLDTICDKLKRHPTMSLYRMQDLGGCRVIVPSQNDVHLIKTRLANLDIPHTLVGQKDYIATPNSKTGYRGIHLIYRYKNDTPTEYNDLRIEIQIRTRLQHLWATAVETVGLLIDEGLKYSQGSDAWLEFFRLVSELFAIEDGTALGKYTIWEKEAIAIRILNLDIKLRAIDAMQTVGAFSKKIGQIDHTEVDGYYILMQDKRNRTLTINQYAGTATGLQEAKEEYRRREWYRQHKDIDIVLVSAHSYETLLTAYPNYFVDISRFNYTMLSIIKKYIYAADDKRQKLQPPNN